MTSFVVCTLPQVLLGHVGNIGEMRNTCKVFVMKSEKHLGVVEGRY
jgi:hypothetical protein